MIENDKQLAITKKWRDDFQAAMQETIRKMPETTEDDRSKKQLYIDTQQSTIDCFNEEIKDYETNGPTIWCKDEIE